MDIYEKKTDISMTENFSMKKALNALKNRHEVNKKKKVA